MLGEPCVGVNYLKEGQDPVYKADSEVRRRTFVRQRCCWSSISLYLLLIGFLQYPDWLWEDFENLKHPSECDEDDPRYWRWYRKQRIISSNASKAGGI